MAGNGEGAKEWYEAEIWYNKERNNDVRDEGVERDYKDFQRVEFA